LASQTTSIAEKVAACEERSLPPTVREWIWVLLIVAALFVFDLFTCNLYPAVWCDEVLFSEPAVNYVQHGSFTTTVWEFQPGNTFPVVNCPLYSLALVPWLSVAGTSLPAIRSFNYALIALAAVLMWLVSWRFELVNNSAARILMLGLFHFGYGMSFAFRCSRPDILALNCLLVFLLSFGINRSLPRYVILFLCSAVTVWIGLQVALYACLACAAAWFFFRRPHLRELVLVAGGMVAGVCSLFILLKMKGVLSYFLPIVVGMMGKHYAHSAHVTLAGALLKWLRVTLMCYLENFTTVLLVPAIIAALVIAGNHFRNRTVFVIRYCMSLIFATPALFNVIGHFAFYYSYMLFVPAFIAIFVAFSELSIAPPAEIPRWLKPSIFVVVMASTLIGLPLRLAITLSTSKLVSRGKMQRLISSQITQQDVVFSDYAPFFEVKNAAAIVYAPYYSSALSTTPISGHDFTPEEKRSITALVIRPEQAGKLTDFFGGQWEPTSESFGDVQDFRFLKQLPLAGSRLAHYAAQPQTERYQVQIFRRVTILPAR
jgi:hypothetical protein